MRNVIMFHSVGNNNSSWKERFLSVDEIQFEKFCCYLQKHKYTTHYLEHWYQSQDEKSNQNKKNLYLTFDDGYLDNLLVAYPIMKHYGIKGTIFVNPEFVDPGNGVRVKSLSGSTLGFLNWDEISFLDKSGVFDIQSHSMSHDYCFSSDRIIDIYLGTDQYHWLPWNVKPNNKPFWQTENQTDFVKIGTPVFEYGRALGVKKYFPDERLVEKSVELYAKHKNVHDVITQLKQLLVKYPGIYETDEQMKERYVYELKNSKQILEQKLCKKIDFLCWPGGGYNDISLSESLRVGYLASTIASKEQLKTFDNNGKIYKRIVRYGMSSIVRTGGCLKSQSWKFSTNPNLLIWRLKMEENSPFYYFFGRLYYLIQRFL